MIVGARDGVHNGRRQAEITERNEPGNTYEQNVLRIGFHAVVTDDEACDDNAEDRADRENQETRASAGRNGDDRPAPAGEVQGFTEYSSLPSTAGNGRSALGVRAASAEHTNPLPGFSGPHGQSHRPMGGDAGVLHASGGAQSIQRPGAFIGVRTPATRGAGTSLRGVGKAGAGKAGAVSE